MDLRSSTPFWLMEQGSIRNYPSLDKDISVPVVIIGAGITGALISFHLSEAGIEHVVVDKGHAGMGSTCASTGLLQYEIDLPMTKLIKKMPEKDAAEAYRLCAYAIPALKKVAKKVKYKDFETRDSLQFASFRTHVDDLEKEYRLRKKHRIAEMEWLTEKELKKEFGFEKPAALLSHLGAAVDPYSFTHRLLRFSEKKGNAVYVNTGIQQIKRGKKGTMLLTNEGNRIHCGHVVIACGYESQRYIPQKVERSNSTFAVISEPMGSDRELWPGNCLIWETAHPYLYLRTTSDGRIIVGGKDTPVSDGDKRNSMNRSKSEALQKEFSKLFPKIQFKADFCWSGFFGETKDGLPYIGQLKKYPDTFFALGFGGNGITYSLLAAEMIRDTLKSKKNKMTELFSFER